MRKTRKDMKKLTVTFQDNDVELSFIRGNYLNNNNTYIGALDSNDEYWTDVSINLYKLNQPDHIFISDLCSIEIIHALEALGLILPSGRFECMGTTYYPEYILSNVFLNEWCSVI